MCFFTSLTYTYFLNYTASILNQMIIFWGLRYAWTDALCGRVRALGQGHRKLRNSGDRWLRAGVGRLGFHDEQEH